MSHLQHIIIYGFGTGGKSAFDILKDDYDVICFVDKDKGAHGIIYHGIHVHVPEMINRFQYDKIVIASMFIHEIKAFLKRNKEMVIRLILLASKTNETKIQTSET